MKQLRKMFTVTFVSLFLVIGFVLAGCVTVSASSEVEFLDSDVFWTKENGPHKLTRPMVIGEGVTLTIEAGTSVDFNAYDLQVKGTLQVLGDKSNRVEIKIGGTIEFFSSAVGWNEETGSGSIIRGARLSDVNVIGNVPVKICENVFVNCRIEGALMMILDNAAIDSIVAPRDSALVIDNTISRLDVYGSPTITSNGIHEAYVYTGSAVISYNSINTLSLRGGSPFVTKNTITTLDGSGGSPVISENSIEQIGIYEPFPKEEIEYFTVDSATITNNVIARGILLSCDSATIANNTIYSYTYSYTYEELKRPPYNLGMWEQLYYREHGVEYEYVTEHATTSGIKIRGSARVLGNVIIGCSVGIEGGKIIEGNLLIKNAKGIVVTEDGGAVRSNNITLGSIGINVTASRQTIENNYISNQTTGILVRSPATIQNNTISNSTNAITIDHTGSINLNYNNFENNQKTIYLIETYGNIDAANNWWGTTDTQTIGNSIHKNEDFSIQGTVVFNPTLNEPNPEATPLVNPEIPEFPASTVLPVFLVATLFVVFCGKRFSEHLKRS